MIYVYKITVGQEKIVLDMLYKKIKKEGLKIPSIAYFEDLKGYLIVEGEDEVSVRQAGLRIPHIKGVLNKPMDVKDIEGMIAAAKPAVLSVSKGDLVELVSGPFKGEKAKVIKIDENNNTKLRVKRWAVRGLLAKENKDGTEPTAEEKPGGKISLKKLIR